MVPRAGQIFLISQMRKAESQYPWDIVPVLFLYRIIRGFVDIVVYVIVLVVGAIPQNVCCDVPGTSRSSYIRTVWSSGENCFTVCVCVCQLVGR